MPPEFRRNVPNLNINVFVYAKSPEDRFVIIDMKKYRAGQETADGLEIKEIKSNSLVISYQNKTFQIKRP
jgi:general secretion pathway protein B